MKVLILGDTDPFIYNIIRSLLPFKIDCHVFARKRMWAVSLSKHCRGYIDVSGLSDEAVLDRINSYCVSQGISVVIPGDFRGSRILVARRDRLAAGVSLFPSADMATLETLHNKQSFARLLKTLGIPQPKMVIVDSFSQLEALDTRFPCIAKQVHGEGGSFERYLKNDREALLASGRSAADFPLMVQEFIPGTDLCLNIFARQGKVLACTMQEYVTPEKMRFFSSGALLELGQKIVAAVNFEGVLNFDIRRDSRDGSFKFIECNPRFWGSMYATTCRGMNFPALGLGLLATPEPLQHDSGDNEYLVTRPAARKLLKGALAWRDIPRLTRDDLKGQFADPLSFLYTVFLWS
ncbi:MAG: ATP-grasp domain-containing protein [Candidatus Omnitrophota bacterium]